MNKTELAVWKKVLMPDLAYICEEFNNQISTPSFVFLTGEMGVGKTTFVKSYLKDFNVTSPTYSVLNDYGRTAHGDFYRLEHENEIRELEMELYFENRDIFFGEWGNKFLSTIESYIPLEWEIFELEIFLSQKNTEENSKSAARDFKLFKIER